jgi:rubrerythrin
MTPTSRRGVLALALAAAPAAIGADAMSAKGNKMSKKNKKNEDTRDKGDIGVLNYALTLEHLEYAFYRDGLATFVNTTDFADPSIRPRLEEIRDHEQAHVDALVSTIQKLGGTPVQAGCYNFGYGTSASQFLKVAQVLENTGVMAYDGAIASIMSANLQTTGATIATVEARHAAYLNLINGEDPFPAAFDTPKSRAEILAAAGGFIVSCSS